MFLFIGTLLFYLPPPPTGTPPPKRRRIEILSKSFTSFLISYSGPNNSSSSNSAASYQTEYSRWENIAERHYNSITNTGFKVRDKQGNRGGSTMQGMNSGNYVQMKKSFRDAQRQMRNIRNNAQRHGVTITQSKWETATIAY